MAAQKAGSPLPTRFRVFSYRTTLLTILALVTAFSYVDRLFLGLALQDIKVDLSLSDTQLGLLTGLVFAAFYSVVGLPIAVWSDRGNRVRIISVTAFLGSVMVMTCGLAGTFAQFALCRVGVAIGEAGATPPANSLLAEEFDRSERPRAMGLYALGGPLAYLIGYFAGGWLNDAFGWRKAFLFLGVPGLVLALLAFALLREPRTAAAPTPILRLSLSSTLAVFFEDMAKTFRLLRTNNSFRNLLLCYSIVCFFGNGVGAWQPAFFERSFKLTSTELGGWLAVIWGFGGIIGTYGGGFWASRYAAGNETMQLRVAAIAIATFGLLSCGTYYAPSKDVALLFLVLAVIGFSFAVGPMFATMQSVLPPRLRAAGIAIVYLAANLIGMGLGPLAVGVLSDHFTATLGAEALRYALLALSPGYLIAACFCWRGGTTVESDLHA